MCLVRRMMIVPKTRNVGGLRPGAFIIANPLGTLMAQPIHVRRVMAMMRLVTTNRVICLVVCPMAMLSVPRALGVRKHMALNVTVWPMMDSARVIKTTPEVAVALVCVPVAEGSSAPAGA